VSLRHKEDFDKWFRSVGGDPWGYQSEFVQDRLKASAGFITRNLGAAFSGSFIEIGAFNGEFSLLLRELFPSCQLVINDISEVALNAARARLHNAKNVTFLLDDALTLRLPPHCENTKSVLLLLECLYYLPAPEREPTLHHLVAEMRTPDIFFSAPITGDPYFREPELLWLFAHAGYRMRDVRVLNYLDAFYGKMALLPRAGRPILRWAANRIPRYRRRYGRQVIYYFAPQRREAPAQR
jgi:SAM-dependent methyltransferase